MPGFRFVNREGQKTLEAIGPPESLAGQDSIQLRHDLSV
jgi:hypothetical protein